MADSKPVTATVTRQFFEGKRLVDEDEKSETIEVLTFQDGVAVASQSVKLGLTVNLGNFESVRADVMVTVPHYEEERDDAFLYALGHCEKKVKLVFGSKSDAQDLVKLARKAMKR